MSIRVEYNITHGTCDCINGAYIYVITENENEPINHVTQWAELLRCVKILMSFYLMNYIALLPDVLCLVATKNIAVTARCDASWVIRRD
jgi:hypothetical protein